MLLPITQEISGKALSIGGCSLPELKQKHGTPLYIIDIETVKKQCSDYIDSFSFMDSRIIYASKAFCCKAMCQLVNSAGMCIDVSTGGELFTALESGFDPKKIYFHGNNKSDAEITYGLENDIGCFIVDNMSELERLDEKASDMGKNQEIMLRITPGIKASTHKYIQTGATKSKFGFTLSNGEAMAAVEKAIAKKNLDLIGIHSHIGSQIFNIESYARLIQVHCSFIASIKERLGASIKQINIGGGLGIKYLEEDEPPSIKDLADLARDTLRDCSKKEGIQIERLYLEPGRSIIGNAGVTLYEVGNVKTIPGVIDYISIDGGMSDNIRPILYQAKYTPYIANDLGRKGPGKKYTIVGKHCESGDMIIEDAVLPDIEPKDLIAIASTGAYCYSMASNYNGQPKPAVVAVEDSKDYIWVERQQYADLISKDRDLYEKR
jgi:diaminopimelate decarboxylase